MRPRHVAKRDRSRYPRDLSQSAYLGQRRSSAVRGSKAACVVPHQAVRPAGGVAGAGYFGGGVGGCRLRWMKVAILHAVLPRVIKSLILEAGGTRSLELRLAPKICKHVVAVVSGDPKARQQLET